MLKNVSIYYFFAFFIIVGCSHEKELILNTVEFNHSENYTTMYNNTLDTLKQWGRDSIESARPYLWNDHWALDSLMLFNSDSTKLLANLMTRNFIGKMDDVMLIGGLKINNNWYYFMGETYVYPRDYYQKEVYVPLTFEELSYLTRKRFYYLVRDKEKVNEYVNSTLTPSVFYPKEKNLSMAKFDSLIIDRYSAIKAQKIENSDIEAIEEEIANYIRPKEPLPEEISFWQKLFRNKQILVFETEEWKEYIASKQNDEK